MDQSDSDNEPDNTEISQVDWFLDSGANAHFCNDLTQFVKYYPVNQRCANMAINATHMPIKETGVVEIKLKSTYGPKTLKMENVFYSPDIRINVLSPAVIYNKSGIWDQWDKNVTLYTKNNEPIGLAIYDNNLWKLVVNSLTKSINNHICMPSGALLPHILAISTNEDHQVHTWYRRLAHLNYQSVKSAEPIG